MSITSYLPDNPAEARHDVLCSCGWGLLSVPESMIPCCCPLCGASIPFVCGDEEGDE